MGELFVNFVELIGMWWFLLLVFVGLPVFFSFVSFVAQEIDAAKKQRKMRPTANK